LKKFSYVLSAILACTFVLGACGNKTNDTSNMPSSTNSSSNKAGNDADSISFTFFSNNPDRKSGQGYAEQVMIDQYMKENPNVHITVETLSPDPQFQDKLKVYNAANTLPEVTMMWGGTRHLLPLVKNEALVTFTEEDFAGQGFIEGGFEPFKYDGKIYGIPKNTDFIVLYVNKKILADHGLEPPQKESDLIKIAEKLKGTDIVPVALDGRDAWPLSILFDAAVTRESGSFDTYKKAIDRTGSYNDPDIIASAAKLQEMVKAGVFGKGFLNLDYGGARNLFGQGNAAMYFMGEWEMGISSDTNFPEEVRNNMIAIPYPASDNGKGKTTDLLAWFGGGYSVTSKSDSSDEAKKFAIWMFKKENWAKTVWQNGITFPAQSYVEFNTGNENQIQRDLTDILTNATNLSGMGSQDRFSTSTAKEYLDKITELMALGITPEKFAADLDAIAEKSNRELNS